MSSQFSLSRQIWIITNTTLAKDRYYNEVLITFNAVNIATIAHAQGRR